MNALSRLSARQAVAHIIREKGLLGKDAYLGIYADSILLWPRESLSRYDNGRNAVRRWTVTDHPECHAILDGLIATGEVDDESGC